MAGLTDTLSIAKSAISAQQYGLSVTGHNISNVNTSEYCRQDVPMYATTPILSGGFLFGSGVNINQIERTVDVYLEERLVDQKSSLAASDAFVSYANVLQGIFNENSDSSLSRLLPDYWNSWHSLSDNPEGPSERAVVVENGVKVVERFDALDKSLQDLQQDLTNEIAATVGEINRIASQIADVNKEMLGLEGNRSANDQRDYRNALVTELGALTDIKTFEQPDGALNVTAAGFALVSGVDSYDLSMQADKVMWEGSYGGLDDITDRISGGSIGGWLDMRDEMIPATMAEIDVLAKEFIWSVNYTHSQGSGTSYFDSPLEGTYSSDETGLLSTMDYGQKIDYTKDFKMWVKDSTTATPSYESISVDMALGTAKATNWTGTEPSGGKARYDFTVLRAGMTGEEVVVTDGAGLSTVKTGDSVSQALDGAIAEQTLSITDADGNIRTIKVADTAGDSQRSAAAIAAELNGLDDVKAYALENTVDLDISNLLPGVADAHENDMVEFEFTSGETSEKISFLVGADAAATRVNFKTALDGVINGAKDLSVAYSVTGDAATIISGIGENIGVGNFDVKDNATITLSNFTQDGGAGAGDASFEIGGVNVNFNLNTTAGQNGAASRLMTGLNSSAAELEAQGISWSLNAAGTGVIITGSDEKDLDIKNVNSHVGNAGGGFTVTGAAGTAVNGVDGGAIVLTEDAVAGTTVASTKAETDTMLMDGTALTETGGAGSDSGVKTSSLTMFLAPGLNIRSNVAAAGGSILDLAANEAADAGNSVITLGGDGGFANFNVGDAISFDVDGINIAYNVAAAPPSNGAQLEAALNSGAPPLLDPDVYSIVRTGESVSIVKKDGTSLDITNFNDGTSGDAQLKAFSGAGFGGTNPVETTLVSGGVTDVSSSVYELSGVMEWRKYDEQGNFTGEEGIISLDDAGPYTVEGNLAFDLSPGTLVAGNTFSVNTGEAGAADPLQLTTRGLANSINDTYKFKVSDPGGKIGEVDVTIEWSNSATSGSFKLKAWDPPFLPVYADVDGMRLQFDDGTVFTDDVFVITTDAQGVPDAELGADMHWTMESFVDQFNRQGAGIEAKVTQDSTVQFRADTDSYEISDLECSGVDGFCEVNSKITVSDYSALTQEDMDFQISRDAAGAWTLGENFTNGVATMIPAGGSDSGFGIDLTGNGVADLQVEFENPVTGKGTIEFDITQRDAESYSFAFSGDNGNDSGLAAALGVNTFFQGDDALTIDVNKVLDETGYVAAARIDEATGEIAKGDNSNALGITNLQYEAIEIKQWTYNRGDNPVSSIMTSSIDDYYHVMVGSVGVKTQSEMRTQSFNQVMVSQMGEQRDSISAVSLDEEMVNLMKYQHAFTAASKLLTVTDEMLNTLVSMR